MTKLKILLAPIILIVSLIAVFAIFGLPHCDSVPPSYIGNMLMRGCPQ